jgi:hypothetical protein
MEQAAICSRFCRVVAVMGGALSGYPMLFGSTSVSGARLYEQGIVVLLPGEIQIGRCGSS